MEEIHSLGVSDRLLGGIGRHGWAVLRLGLAAIILMAGAHKLVAPGVWHAYLAPPVAAVWPTGVIGFDALFVLFGLSEVFVGVLLVLDWHTPTVAAVTAVSLAGVVVNLVVGIGVGAGHVDVLVRDVGLTAYALGVALEAGRRRRHEAGPRAEGDEPADPTRPERSQNL